MSTPASEVSRKRRRRGSFGLAFHGPKVEDEVRSLHVAPVAHLGAKRGVEEVRWVALDAGERGYGDEPDAVDLPHCLRVGDERRGERPDQRGQQEAAAVHHSIT
jgi:hypothetical protein